MSRDVLSSEEKRKSQAQLQNQIPKKGQKRNGRSKDKSEKKWRVNSINLGFSRWLIARPIESNEVSKLAIVVQMIFLFLFFSPCHCCANDSVDKDFFYDSIFSFYFITGFMFSFHFIIIPEI